MIARKLLVSACLFALFLACGGSTSTGNTTPSLDGGASDDASAGAVPAATPRAIVKLNGGAAADCATVPPLKVGDFPEPSTGAAARPVPSGGAEGGKVVTVTCRVVPSASGGGFDLQATVAIAGDASLSLQGTLDTQGKTTSGGLVLEKGATKWTSSKCSADPSALPMAGVAAGRYWALFSCMGATSDSSATCDLFGELRLENCAQQ